MHKAFSFLFVTFLVAPPAAFALNSRSAVSVNGSDTHPCTVASPCRSFTTALNATAANGEVIALDSAGYGPFEIFLPVTVSGAPGVHAAITSSSVGIYINANAGDEVTVRNLVLINAGGTYGIQQVGVGNLRVLDCVLRGFTLAAIEWHVGNLSVDHSTIIDSDPGAGIAIDGTNSGSDVAEMTITNSLIEGYWKGIRARGHASAMVANCTITRGLVGVAAESQDGTGVPASITIEATTITRNSSGIAAIASGANNTAIVYLAQDDVSYNTTGATNIGGSILSFGNNKFTENGSDGGPFAPIALQ